MSVALARRSWATNVQFDSSRIYSASPYRPYAGMFSRPDNVSTDQYTQTLARAISPFSVNDQNLINAIRAEKGITDTRAYDIGGKVGSTVGFVAGALVSKALYGKALTTAVASIGTANPVGLAISAGLTLAAVAGTIMTSMEIGGVLGKSVASEEGRTAMNRYIANLGVSFAKRPISTFVTAATIYGSHKLSSYLGIKNAYVKQGISMVSVKLTRSLGADLDDKLIGELDEESQLSYTDLLSLQGDLADLTSGTTFVKSALVGIKKGGDESSKLLAQAFGHGEEGFDALDFNDVREAWDVDMGSFKNGVIDMLGEIVFDTDNLGGRMDVMGNKEISTAVENKILNKILSDQKSEEFKRYFKINEEGKIEAKDSYHLELGNKSLQLIVKEVLKKYNDPLLAKNEANKIEIEKNNKDAISESVYKYYANFYLRGVGEKDKNKATLTSEFTKRLEKNIEDALLSLSSEINKRDKKKIGLYKSVDEIVKNEKNAKAKVSEGLKNNAYNFDKSLLKEMEKHNFKITDKKLSRILRLHPILRTYSDSNDTTMKVLGYFTRPAHTIISSKTMSVKIKQLLGKTLRKFDPYQKFVSIEDLIIAEGQEGPNVKVYTKEDFEKSKEETQELRKKMNDHKKSMQKKSIIQFLKNKKEQNIKNNELNESDVEAALKDILVRLNDIEEQEKILKASPTIPKEQLEALQKIKEEVLDMEKEYRKEAIASLENDKNYKKYVEEIKEIEKRNEDLKIKEEILDDYMSSIRYVYITSNEEKIQDVNEKNEKEIIKEIQRLEEKPNKTWMEKANLESMTNAFFRFKNSGQFVKEYKSILKQQSTILDIVTSYEMDFTAMVYRLQNFNTNSNVFWDLKEKSDDIKKVQKQIEDRIKSLDKSELTQAESLNKQKDLLILNFDKQIVEVFKEINNTVDGKPIFDAKDFEEIRQVILNNGTVLLDINYATNIFGFIKLNFEDKHFFLNNKELYDDINEFVSGKRVQTLLDRLRGSVNRKNRKSFDYTSTQSYNLARTELTKMLDEFFGQAFRKKSSDPEIAKKIEEQLDGIVLSLINTHQKMEINSDGEILNKYKKNFSMLTKNEMIEFAMEKFKNKHETMSSDSEKIDKTLKILERKLQSLKKKYSGMGISEYLINEIFSKQMSKMNNSKIITAINAKYKKVGETQYFFEKVEQVKYEEKVLSEQEKVEVSKMKEIKTDSQIDEERQAVKNTFYEFLTKATKGTAMSPLLEKMGVDEAFEIFSNRKVEENKIEKIELDGPFAKYDNVVNKIIALFESKNQGIPISDEQKNELTVKYLNLIDEEKMETEKKYFKTIFSEPRKYLTRNEKQGFIALIKNSPIGSLIGEDEISLMLRGKVTKGKTMVDLDNSPYGDSLIKFMSENEPTEANILKIMIQPLVAYSNFDGSPVRIRKASQIGIKNLPPSWRSKYYDSIKDTDGETTINFFKNRDFETKKAFTRFIEGSFDLPESFRNHFKQEANKLADEDFEIINKKDALSNPDESLVNDFIRLFLTDKELTKHNIGIAVHKDTAAVDTAKGKNEVHVIRLIIAGKSYDFYIPKKESELNEYKINGNEYIRMKIYDEKDKLTYINKIKNAFTSDFISAKDVAEKSNSGAFIPYELQHQIYKIFYAQRLVEGVDEDSSDYVNDFMYIDPSKTSYQKYIYANSYRLSKEQQKDITRNPDEFVNELKSKGYFVNSTQGDPNRVMKGIEIQELNEDGEKVIRYASLTQVVNPFASITGRAERSAKANTSITNAIKLKNPDKASVRSADAKGLEDVIDIGLQPKVLLSDKKFKTTDERGVSSYNEMSIMTREYAEIKFAKEGEEKAVLSDGMKIIDRHSSKHVVSFVSKEEMKRITGRDDIDLVLPLSAVKKRTLFNLEVEMHITGDGEVANDKVITHINKNVSDDLTPEQEKALINKNLLDQGIDINKAVTEEERVGFLYMYLADDLKEGFKTSGDEITVDNEGAKLSIEELQLLDALRDITSEVNGKEMVLDQKNEILNYFWNKSETDQSAVLDELYGDTQVVKGKKGKLRKKVVERQIPNSGYAKVVSNWNLPPGTIRIPLEMAKSMGLLNENGTLETSNYSDTALFHRFPTQGRRSFVHVKVLINPDVNSKIIESHPGMDKALNLDFDGDGAAIYSYKGAGRGVINASMRAFGHTGEETNFSDYPKGVRDGSGENELALGNEKDFSINKEIDDLYIDQSKENYKEHIKSISKKADVVTEKDFDNVMMNQKILKEYSALFKNIIDADYQNYSDSDENVTWFKTFMESEENTLNFKSFYGLTTLAYDFYSQKSFDFSKHGNKAQKEAFEKIYSKMELKQGQTFKDHIKILVKVLKYDIEAYAKYDEDIKKAGEDVSLKKQITEDYVNNLSKFLETISVNETELKNKVSEQVISDEDYNKMKDAADQRFKTKDDDSKDLVSNEENIKRKGKELIKKMFESADVQVSEKELDDMLSGEEGKAILKKIDNNEVNKFDTSDYNVDLGPKEQIFTFLINNKNENKIAKTQGDFKTASSVRVKTDRQVMAPFYSRFKSFSFDIIKMLYNEPGILKNVNILMKVKTDEGKLITKKVNLLNNIKLYKMDDEGRRFAYQPDYQSLNPSVLKKQNMEFLPFGLDNPNLVSFEIVMSKGSSTVGFDKKVSELFKDIQSKISLELANQGMGRSFVVSPLIHNKQLYSNRIFGDIIDAIYKNGNSSALIKILSTIEGGEEIINDLKEILEPFMIHQEVSQYIEGDIRTNLVKYILESEDIFDPTAVNDVFKDFGVKANEREISVMLRKYGLITSSSSVNKKQGEVTNIEEFKNLIADKFKLTDALEINKKAKEFADMYFHVVKNLDKTSNFNSLGHLYNKTTVNYKIDLVQKLMEVREGAITNNKDNILFGADLTSMPKNYEMDTDRFSAFYNIYNHVYKIIENTIDLSNKETILSMLDSEKEMIHIGDNIVRNVNRELSKHVTSNITILNDKGSVTGSKYHLRGAIHPDNSKENQLVLRNSVKNKGLVDLNRRLIKLLYKGFNKDGVDSDFLKEIQTISDDYKLSSDFLSLYIYEGKTNESYISELEKLSSITSTVSLPLTQKQIKIMLMFNKMSLAMGFKHRKIMPHNLDVIYRELKQSNVIDKENNINMNTVYRQLFLENLTEKKSSYDLKKQEYKDAVESGDKKRIKLAITDTANALKEYEGITKQLAEFKLFLDSEGGSFNTFGLKSQHFVETFFGKVIFEELGYKQADNSPSKDRVSVSKEIIKKTANTILEKYELNQALTDSTSGKIIENFLSFKDSSVDPDKLLSSLDKVDFNKLEEEDFEKFYTSEKFNDEEKQFLLLIKDFFIDKFAPISNDSKIVNVDKEVAKELLTAYKKILNGNYISEDTKVVDTLEIAKDTNAMSDMDIKKFSLINIFLKLQNKSEISSDELTALGIDLKRQIVSTEHGAHYKGNAKLHTAMIDAQLTFEVLKMMSENFKYEDFVGFDELAKLVQDFKTPEKRKDFVIFDTENIVSTDINNRIYEISYISFTESGEPVYTQRFLDYDLDANDKSTLLWLKNDKKFTSSEIKNILKSTRGITDLNHNLKMFEETFKDFEGKVLVGQNIRGTDGDGDIAKLNREYERILKSDLSKLVYKYNATETEVSSMKELNIEDYLDKVLNNVPTLKTVDGSEQVDKTSVNQKFNTSQKIDAHITILKEKLAEDLKERFLYEGIEQIDSTKHEMYSQKMLKLSEAFVTIPEGKKLKAELESILGIRIDNKTFKLIKSSFDQKLAELVSNGYLLKKMPKAVYDAEADKIVIEYVPADEIDPVFRINYDANSTYSKFSFRMSAFYEIIKEVKDMITIEDMSYKKYERLSFEKITFDSLKYDRTDDIVNLRFENYNKFVSQGEEIKALIELDKLIKRQNILNAKSVLDDKFMSDEMAFDEQKVKDVLTKHNQENKFMNMSESEVNRIVESSYNDIVSFLNDKLSSKTSKPLDKPTKTKVTLFVERVKDGIEKHSFDKNNSPISLEEFSKLIEINDNDFVRAYYDAMLNKYQDFVQNGLRFELKDGSKSKNLILYSKDTEVLFKNQAFLYALYSNDLRSDGSKNLLLETIKGKGATEFETYEKDETKIKSIEDVIGGTSRKLHENETNKLYFENEKLRIKNLLLYGKFDEVEARYKNSPGFKESFFSDFKKRFDDKFNSYMKDGLPIKEYVHVFEDGRFKVSPVVKDNQKMLDNEVSRSFVRKEVIKEMTDDINELIHIDKHRTSIDNSVDLEQPLSYLFYINNIDDYDGVWRDVDYKKDNSYNSEIDDTYSYAFKKTETLDSLEKYQSNFFDMIAPFKNKDGSYDIDKLWQEISDGYLSRVFKITVITDISKQEVEYFKSVNQEGNRYYDYKNQAMSAEGKDITSKDYEVFGDSKILDAMKNTAIPTLKVIEFKNKEEFANFLNHPNIEDMKLGFTTNTDLIKSDELSYTGYKLPKPIALFQNSVIRVQRFMMLANSGFLVRNIYDGLIRNHKLVYGTDRFFSENGRFLKEAVRTFNLVNKYKKYSSIHLGEMTELKDAIFSLKHMNGSKVLSDSDLSDISNSFEVYIARKVDSIESYLKNVISDETQKGNKGASDNYKEFFRIKEFLSTISSEIKESRTNGVSDVALKEFLMSKMVDFFEVYHKAGFFKQSIMNANKNKNLDFSLSDKDSVRRNKDELNLIRFLNEIEKSGVISDQYEISGKQEVRDIYKEINNLDQFLDTEIKKSFIGAGFSALSKMNPLSFVNGFIEQHQRIHGIMLQTYHNGMYKDEAINESLKRFFNYGMKGAYEKSATLYFPFMSFAIRNLDYHLEVMRDQKYMRFMTNIAQGVSTWYDEEDEDNPSFSNGFGLFSQNQGWIPLGKNYGMKMGNAMFDAFDLIDDPFQGVKQKLNPALQQLNNLSTGQGFDKMNFPFPDSESQVYKGPTTVALSRSATAVNNIFNNEVSTPADVLPSLFYNRNKYTPYKYRKYNSDFRNIYNQLFFTDGSRRSPSKNPYTTAKNIRYQTYVNARLQGARR